MALHPLSPQDPLPCVLTMQLCSGSQPHHPERLALEPTLKFYKFYVQAFAHFRSRSKNQCLHHIINLRHCVTLTTLMTDHSQRRSPDPLPHASHLHLILHPPEIPAVFPFPKPWHSWPSSLGLFQPLYQFKDLLNADDAKSASPQRPCVSVLTQDEDNRL